MPSRKFGIQVVEKVLTMKEQDQMFLTNKTILAFMGGVSKDFVDDLRKSGELHYYKVRNTILYKVSDVVRLIEKNKVI